MAAGLTQEALARRSRVSVDAISAYENGRDERTFLAEAAEWAERGPQALRPASPMPERAAVFLGHTSDLREQAEGRSFVTAAEAAVSGRGTR